MSDPKYYCEECGDEITEEDDGLCDDCASDLENEDDDSDEDDE